MASSLRSLPAHSRLFALSVLATTLLAACGGSDGTPQAIVPPPPAVEATPLTVALEKIGSYATGEFVKSAAEITAYDAVSKRSFVVNALAGAVDVLDLSNPAKPVKVGRIEGQSVLAGAEINSVAVRNGLVAVAMQAKVKTDNGRMALYDANTLALISQIEIGAQPDMVTFTPDGKYVLVANEGEPSDDYQIDPEGSVSVIDVSDAKKPQARTAGFTQFNGQEAALRARGVRIFGPKATAARDFEPEYIAVSADSRTAWVTLQENNALARIDLASAQVTSVTTLGYKDNSLAANALDIQDEDGKINITTWAGLRSLYMPDSIAAYDAGGKTYLVTANEGDARAWGENNPAYVNGDTGKGFMEEFRVKHLTNAKGWSGRKGDDLPAHLNALAAGGLLNPATFAYCGAAAGTPGKCRDDDVLGRLKVTWTQGYQQNADGTPVLYTAAGVASPTGDRLMYDNLYAFGGRSFSIWDDNGALVWDSGAAIETFLASDACKLGSARSIPCKTYFNTGHDALAKADARSSAKGPEPEGLTVGKVGNKTFAFVGLERMGGVLVYDITNPRAPLQMDYLNTREGWDLDPAKNLDKVGDLGPEGLHFVPAAASPNGKPLLIVGNEVSGTTAIFQLKMTY
ncbi:MAG: choice-of-anchor I family protein [Comamonas sp.]|uniref:choice-of-anchor I family protein n=1 Tax=Comamonas sp. TaxID=34028 RepID=UPI002FCC09B4